MPELPEVETIRRGLKRTILGKTMRKAEIRLPKIISVGPQTVSNHRKARKEEASQFKKLLVGKKIVEVIRRAKMLLLGVNNGSSRIRHLTPALSDIGEGARARLWILIHLKMTGQLIFVKKGEKKLVKIMNTPSSQKLTLPHKYTHAIFEFVDGSKLFYNDLRQFGYLRLVRDEDVAQVRELNEYGPEPFAKTFSFQYLLQQSAKRPKSSIKQFLTAPRIIAGIGNIYSDEILYMAKIRPQRRMSGIKNEELGRIYKNIKVVLKKAIAARGSSVGDFFTVQGKEGAFGKRLMVYGRGGEKCRKCGTIIQTTKIAGRTSSYCPNEQK